MIETYIFPLPPTLNEIIRVARTNEFLSAKQKKEWTNKISVACYGRYRFSGEVWLSFLWYVKFNRDPDNVVASVKFILDGLVDALIIKDDSLKTIQSFDNRFRKVKPGENEIVTLYISDREDFKDVS